MNASSESGLCATVILWDIRSVYQTGAAGMARLTTTGYGLGPSGGTAGTAGGRVSVQAQVGHT